MAEIDKKGRKDAFGGYVMRKGLHGAWRYARPWAMSIVREMQGRRLLWSECFPVARPTGGEFNGNRWAGAHAPLRTCLSKQACRSFAGIPAKDPPSPRATNNP